eukprot:TRINITY_DN11871_c0_g1_i2.p1 TRINITY_DN11871_c0_g1~~TRINITY_DN11871_c0_g1_i2.p1  ORF type:complete len:924 (-),score=187.79 TRINITY_DN11871_c0_g1_i2:24-2708(-)
MELEHSAVAVTMSYSEGKREVEEEDSGKKDFADSALHPVQEPIVTAAPEQAGIEAPTTQYAEVTEQIPYSQPPAPAYQGPAETSLLNPPVSSTYPPPTLTSSASQPPGFHDERPPLFDRRLSIPLTHIVSDQLNSSTIDGAAAAPTDRTIGVDIFAYAPPSLEHTTSEVSSPRYVPPAETSAVFSSSKIPNRRDMAASSHLPFGMLFSPVAPLEPAPPCLRRPPVKCKKCGGIINRYCKLDQLTGRWNCIFCRVGNDGGEQYRDIGSTYLPELDKNVVEYLDPTQQPFPILNSSLETSFVFVVDLNIAQKEMQNLRAALAKALSSLPKSSRVGLVTFSTVITVYQVGIAGIAHGEVLSGASPLRQDDCASILERIDRFLPPIGESIDSFLGCVDAFASFAPNSKSPQRSLGSAVEVAMALLGVNLGGAANASASLGRVAVFMGGSPNFGPGGISETKDETQDAYQNEQAREYYKKIALRAHQHDVGIDIFCIGLKQFHTNILQNLVMSNGGLVIMQKDGSTNSDEFAENIELAIARTCGRQGSFDIRCSDSLSVNHIIGPAIPVQQEDELAASNATSCKMGGVQPRLCYAISYEMTEDVVEDFVYFQFVVKFTNLQNQTVLRVVTQSLPTTGNMTTFLGSVDVDVVAILLAKKFVLEARKKQDVDEVLDELDKSLRNIAINCGTKDKRLYQFSRELAPLPRKIFLLRRGPMLGPILQHPDDIDFLRSLFLNGNLDDCKRLIEPPLFMVYTDAPAEDDVDDSASFLQVPLEDLALQSNKILLLDHHTDIFLWSGMEVAGEAFASKRQTCLRRAAAACKHRFPRPHVMQFKEGSSMARWLQCRLIPAHKDSADEQVTSFPQLDELTPEQKTKLASKFHRTDDASYNQYYRSLFKAQ